MACLRCAPQNRPPVQRWLASPSSRTAALPQMGQLRGMVNWARAGHAPLGQHRHHLGDHVARAAHDDRVAHAHVLAAGFVFVVQGGVGHGHAAHEHRRQLGHRGELAGAAHLHVDVQHGGELLLRRVLVRHGPARLAGDKAQRAAAPGC
jgi:hypothetical protein